MPMHRNALLLAAGLAVLSLIAAPVASAQKYYERGTRTYQRTPSHSPRTPTKPPRSDNRHHGGRHNGGFNEGAAIGAAIGVLPGIIRALPRNEPPPGGGQFIDDGSIDEPIDHVRRHRPRRVRPRTPRRVQVPLPPPRRVAQRPSGVPPAGETRLIPDEVVIELSNAVSDQQITALQNRFQLQRIESYRSTLSGTTMFRWRIPDSRSVPDVVRALEQDSVVASAQPNYRYTLQQNPAAPAHQGDPAQYELAKLDLLRAHTLANGDDVRVAVIDSAVDLQSPELTGSIAGHFDTLKSPRKAHAHGTAIAALIAAHGKLVGAAPGAKILAVRAFDPDSAGGAQGSTFSVLKGLDWAAEHHAQIINMSFAGPADPALQRALEAAHDRGMVLIAAAGNAGAESPPLYPAAYRYVIAVSATDADNHLLEQSNRGDQIALAAPGKDVLVALPGGTYEVSSGTSYSAAEVSGVAALLIERDGTLTPGRLRALLQGSAKDLGPKGYDPMFGFGLVNAYDALTRETAPVTAAVPLPIARVSDGPR